MRKYPNKYKQTLHTNVVFIQVMYPPSEFFAVSQILINVVAFYDIDIIFSSTIQLPYTDINIFALFYLQLPAVRDL